MGLFTHLHVNDISFGCRGRPQFNIFKHKTNQIIITFFFKGHSCIKKMMTSISVFHSTNTNMAEIPAFLQWL